jgi:hypothetical protein
MKCVIFAVAFIAYLLPSSVFSQQRIIVDKATGDVVDVGDRSLQYDTRYFDNVYYPVAVIPEGENFRKYMRDPMGAIVLRPEDELKRF